MNKNTWLIALIITLFITNCKSQNNDKTSGNIKESSKSEEVINLTDEYFKAHVFNYSASKNWQYNGEKPCIIDFYADWCGPCKMLSPRLEEIAREYSGKLVVYKVNTDKEQMLSTEMGISSLPTLLFCPVKGLPQASIGLISKETIVRTINDVLLIK
jgi:thioredoxin